MITKDECIKIALSYLREKMGMAYIMIDKVNYYEGSKGGFYRVAGRVRIIGKVKHEKRFTLIIDALTGDIVGYGAR